jgi:hypothetical protein
VGIGEVHDTAEEEKHEDQLQQEPQKSGEVEPERLVTLPQPVIER